MPMGDVGGPDQSAAISAKKFCETDKFSDVQIRRVTLRD